MEWRGKNPHRPPPGLTQKLLLVCLGLYLAIASLVTVFEVTLVSRQSQKAADQEILSLARTFSPPLSSALWNFDEAQIRILLKVMGEIPAVGRLKLTTTEGRVFESPPRGGPGTVELGPARAVPLFQEMATRSVYLGILSLEPSLTAVRTLVMGTLSLAAARTFFVVALLSVVLVFTARRFVGRPLKGLSDQIGRIDPRGQERLDPGPGAGAELCGVADSFNALLAELRGLNASLETKVAERTADLDRKNTRLEQTVLELSSTRDKLVESAKLAVLGQLVAEVVHDLNTPLGAALSASGSALEMLGDLKNELKVPGGLIQGDDPGLIGELFQRTAPESRKPGIPGSRRRRQLGEELGEAGLGDPASAVEALVELGLDPPLGPLALRLADDRGRRALETARRVASLESSCRIMGLASGKMAGVVDNLLRYVRKEGEAAFVPTDLESQLETTLILFASALRAGITVERHFGSIAEVVGKPDRLQQVWINLVANAIQAMDGKGTLGLGLAATDQEITVTVSDTGHGISPEVAPKLFTPAFTTKPRGAGTGLGLSICRRIVEEHEGKIGFESVPGRTVFTVRFPLRILKNAPRTTEP